MKILKIKGKSEASVLQEIDKEYGDRAVIINRTTEKRKGLIGLFKKPQYSLTIAVDEEKNSYQETKQVPKEIKKEDTPNQDPNYLATQNLLIELKQQLEEIKKDIKTEDAVADQNLVQEVSLLYQKIKGQLQEEGITKEALDFILEGTEALEDIKEMTKKIYLRLLQILGEAPIEPNQSKNIFFIGSTGVGKTTTIAKLTAHSVLKEQKKIALFTADTYRIAAIEQLRTYADILNVPIEIIYSEKDLQGSFQKWESYDHFFIDTAGRSHKNVEQMEELKELLSAISDKKVYLVLNINTSPRDIKQIIDVYSKIVDSFELIITKIDETDEIGNLINIAYYTKTNITYITHGQNVPDDFSLFNKEDFLKKVLGRITYE